MERPMNAALRLRDASATRWPAQCALVPARTARGQLDFSSLPGAQVDMRKHVKIR